MHLGFQNVTKSAGYRKLQVLAGRSVIKACISACTDDSYAVAATCACVPIFIIRVFAHVLLGESRLFLEVRPLLLLTHRLPLRTCQQHMRIVTIHSRRHIRHAHSSAQLLGFVGLLSYYNNRLQSKRSIIKWKPVNLITGV